MLPKIPGLGKLAGVDPGLLVSAGGEGAVQGPGRRATARRRARQKGKRKQARKARKKNRRR
jgi:hypothetical protein